MVGDHQYALIIYLRSQRTQPRESLLRECANQMEASGRGQVEPTSQQTPILSNMRLANQPPSHAVHPEERRRTKIEVKVTGHELSCSSPGEVANSTPTIGRVYFFCAFFFTVMTISRISAMSSGVRASAERLTPMVWKPVLMPRPPVFLWHSPSDTSFDTG